MTRAAWSLIYNNKLANQIARLVATVVKDQFLDSLLTENGIIYASQKLLLYSSLWELLSFWYVYYPFFISPFIIPHLCRQANNGSPIWCPEFVPQLPHKPQGTLPTSLHHHMTCCWASHKCRPKVLTPDKKVAGLLLQRGRRRRKRKKNYNFTRHSLQLT